MSHQPSPGPSAHLHPSTYPPPQIQSSASNSGGHTQTQPGVGPHPSASMLQNQNPNMGMSRQKLKSFTPGIGIAAGAEDAKYKAKYKELRKKVKEIEADNDKLVFKTLQAKRNIQRMRIERAIIYERLSATAQYQIPPSHQAAGPPSYPGVSRHHYSSRDIHDPYVGGPGVVSDPYDSPGVEGWYRTQSGSGGGTRLTTAPPPNGSPLHIADPSIMTTHPGIGPTAHSSRHSSAHPSSRGGGGGGGSHQQSLPSLSSIQHLEPPRPHELVRVSHPHSPPPPSITSLTSNSRGQFRVGNTLVSGYDAPPEGIPVPMDRYQPRPPPPQDYNVTPTAERERERSASGRSRRSDIHELTHEHQPSPGGSYIPGPPSVSASTANSTPAPPPPPSVSASVSSSLAPSMSLSMSAGGGGVGGGGDNPLSPTISHSQASSSETRTGGGSGHMHRHQRLGPGTNINNVRPPGYEAEYIEKERLREMNDRERVKEWEVEREQREMRRGGISASVGAMGGRPEYDERGHGHGHGHLGAGSPPYRSEHGRGRAGDAYGAVSPRSRSGSLARQDPMDEEARERMYYDREVREREYRILAREREEEEDMRLRRGEAESYARFTRGDDVDMEEVGHRRGGSP